MRWLIGFSGLARRELKTTLTQPRLLLVLVLGPFAILLLFGGGYRNETISLRTMFVTPENEELRAQIVDNQDSFADYVVPVGFTDDLVAAQEQLRNDEVDIVVVFPPDPEEKIRAGERVEIAVLHDKIDPIQLAAVDIASEVAVAQINAAVVTEIVRVGQSELDAEGSQVQELLDLSDRLDRATAARSDAEIEELSVELDQRLTTAALAADTSSRLLAVTGEDARTADEREQLAQLQSDLDEASMTLATIRRDPAAQDAPQRAVELNSTIQELSGPLEELRSIPAEVLVRPFDQDTESIVGRWISPVDFFVPSAIALLIQHAALTFAALTIVGDRDLGIMEHYQVSSTPPSAILLGKAVAFVLVGGVLAAALVTLVRYALGVKIEGTIWSLVAVFVLLLAAAVAVGLVLSMLSRSDTQAVQFAMLTLLASMFFGGFFLSLDALRYPFKGVSWILPVTYAIRGLQDVILRGQAPNPIDLAGLGAITVVAAMVAWLLLRREVRPA
ncbi:MAG: ABC transporter permease [Acidimicrobiales bacterium]